MKLNYGDTIIVQKQCPFCGVAGEISRKKNFDEYVAQCRNKDCPASYMIGATFDTAEEAEEFWNTRHIED